MLNIHERLLEAAPDQVGALLDALASGEDRLWPLQAWPRMKLDRPLAVGANGGHGPIRYFVEEYAPGQSIRFRFTDPQGFDGYHGFEIVPISKRATLLRHMLKMKAHGRAVLSWPLVYRPLHDALIEDALTTAQAALNLTPHVSAWSLWVKTLRWLVSGGKAPAQNALDNRAEATV